MDKGFKRYLNTLKKSGKIDKQDNSVGCLGMYRFTLEDVNTGKKTIQYYHNIIPNSGLSNFANNMTSASPTYSLLVNYAALGSGTSTPAAGDTTLQTEVYRNAIASKTNSTVTAYCTAFFNQTETTGTYREAGIFSNATGTVNSGVLMSRVSINVTKTNTQKLTIDWTITFTSA